MNFALPALVILLGILPGVAFYYAYFAGLFEKRKVGVSGVEEVGLYIFFAIPLDAAAYGVCRLLGIYLDADVVVGLLIGNLSPEASSYLVAIVHTNAWPTAWTYVAILVSSFLLGTAVRRLVWRFRLDTYMHLIRLRHPWWYLFQGRAKEFPPTTISYVDVLVDHPDDSKSRLYRGVVADFDMGADGKLESLILQHARRGTGRGVEFHWKDIPSTQLVIMGKTIHSINVTYYTMEERDQPPAAESATDETGGS